MKKSHLNALIKREEDFPTGIVFSDYSIAIPHCEAEHSVIPAICLMRLEKTVLWHQADDNTMTEVSLILGLVVTSPADQLKLLKRYSQS